VKLEVKNFTVRDIFVCFVFFLFLFLLIEKKKKSGSNQIWQKIKENFPFHDFFLNFLLTPFF